MVRATTKKASPKKSASKKPMSDLYKDKTMSKIPKTPREKKMWIGARRIVAAQAGKPEKGKKDETLTDGQWGLVTTIYKDAKKADKIPQRKDWKDAKVSKTVKSYKR